MKKIFLTILVLVGFMSLTNAQWVSPGNGTTFTMEDLVAASNGAVTNVESNIYSINNDLTISTGDTWNITNDVAGIYVEEITITVNGTLNAEGDESQKILFSGNENPFTFRLESATADINGVSFVKGGVIHVINSEATFNECEFKQFYASASSSAVNYMGSNPVFENCYFYENEAAAIGSGINVQGSPRIQNCIFENNDTSNGNYPQINIGPGATDTIYIINNTITGNYNMSGGISISDIASVGSTKIRIQGNTITNNRYGINQQGKTISSVICNNTIVDNNLETNPNNGGSGISIYGLSTDCKAIIRHNTIKGNLWGITAISQYDIDLGTEDDYGHNNIFGNISEGQQMDLYVYSTIDIQAVGNYWGTTDEAEISAHIYDKNDNSAFGEAFFKPFLNDDGINENQSLTASITPNPVTNGIITISFEKEVCGEMSIYSATGQVVATQTIENQINNINIDNLESGVYFVVIRSSEGTMTKKIVKR